MVAFDIVFVFDLILVFSVVFVGFVHFFFFLILVSDAQRAIRASERTCERTVWYIICNIFFL